MAEIPGLMLIRGRSGGGGWQQGSSKKKFPRGTPSSSHMLNKLPYQSQTTTKVEAKCLGDTLGPCYPIKAPPEVPYWLLSDFHGQEKAVWKSRPGCPLGILLLYFDSV